MKKILTVIFTLILLYSIAYTNIREYSVFYAENVTSKRGGEPQLEMLAVNINWISVPYIEGFTYEKCKVHAGIHYIDNKTKERSIFIGKQDNLSHEQTFFFSDSKDNIYEFTNDMKLISLRGKKAKHMQISECNREKVIDEIYDLVQPVLDERAEPIINLQWFFNFEHRYEYDPK